MVIYCTVPGIERHIVIWSSLKTALTTFQNLLITKKIKKAKEVLEKAKKEELVVPHNFLEWITFLFSYHKFSIRPPGGLIDFKRSRGRAYWRGGLVREGG